MSNERRALTAEQIALLTAAVRARGVGPVAAQLGVSRNGLTSALLGVGRNGTILLVVDGLPRLASPAPRSSPPSAA